MKGLALSLAGAAVMAVAPVYTAGLQPGQFSVTPLGQAQPTNSVCVSDLLALYRVAHGPDRCRYFTVSQEATSTRVSYECAGGSGIVTVKAVTPRAANITASGVRGRDPYNVQLVARRTGDCR